MSHKRGRNAVASWPDVVIQYRFSDGYGASALRSKDACPSCQFEDTAEPFPKN